ncbi:UbiA family prenyltransferase [Sphaerisporangium sp. TRM90804]|uniref:UbiA family prenyltransferase n=1 Tax=Sphaerisporangium sp. TRM90804 TaxID=3031113 RepID=UPI00244D3FDA|nr:UbiA family prenyltransferase [Sphaerisporangium sp. TRM90804]MDH2429790.1 UbiA family prenyltransferase [Sphaerisporangium sp. TRM90804]
MVILLRASHPGPTAVVTAAGVALAVSAGRGAGGALLVGAAVLSGQLSIGWSNDWIDRVRDRAIGRADKPLAGAAVAPRTVAVAAFAALAACVPLSLASGVAAGAVHLAAVACGWLYNLWLKSGLASPLPFAAAFGLLPAFVTLGLPGHPWPAWWAPAAGALLGMGAHFANVVPDLPDDLALGVRGLPQRLGATWARVGAALLLVAASVVIALAPEGGGGPVAAAGLGAVALVLLAGLVWARRSVRQAAFGVTVAAAVIDLTMFVAQGGRLV